jgi:glycosyltransferase involved in cell wall biosynthesis
MRGGEKVLSVLAEMFPQAPIYTLLARRDQLDAVLAGRRIETSWLQRLAWIPDLQRKALPVLTAAARSLDATRHDVVICSDAATIKDIRIRPDALKICYCYSPMRYVWDLYDDYYARAGMMGRLGLRLFADRARRNDRKSADSVTAFISISRLVADRIRRTYGRNSAIIYPPVNLEYPPQDSPPEDFYLVVGEHVNYKRNDLAIEACNHLRRPLVVIGGGPLLNEMRQRAGPTVKILGWQPDDVVRDHYHRCRALLFCGIEDFGIVPVEAQAAGRPVIALGNGGAAETVVADRSGVFFPEQTVGSVAQAIERFESSTSLWPPERIQEHTRQFSTENFCRRFRLFYDWCVDHWDAGGPARVRQAVEAIDPESFQ